MRKNESRKELETEKRKVESEKKKRLSEMVYSLAKLSFGGFVIGEGVYWHSGEISSLLMVLGISLTILFMLIAYKIN